MAEGLRAKARICRATEATKNEALRMASSYIRVPLAALLPCMLLIEVSAARAEGTAPATPTSAEVAFIANQEQIFGLSREISALEGARQVMKTVGGDREALDRALRQARQRRSGLLEQSIPSQRSALAALDVRISKLESAQRVATTHDGANAISLGKAIRRLRSRRAHALEKSAAMRQPMGRGLRRRPHRITRW